MTTDRNQNTASLLSSPPKAVTPNGHLGANKHDLLMKTGSMSCILFQSSLCCPARLTLALLQLALEREEKN